MSRIPAVVPYALAVAVLFTGLSSLSARPNEAEIVRNGVPRACVLIAADAHDLEKEAAVDLQETVRRATGAKLMLLNAPQGPGRLLPIRIGRAAVGAAPALSPSALEDLPYDGAAIEAGSKGVFIAGPTPVGTADGVATVLLEDLGLRMYYPHPLFAVVPKAESIRIRSRTATPSFDYRVWSGIVGPEGSAYQRRNRLTDRRVPVPFFGFGHNLGRIIPVEEYGETHPEYFAFRDGKRRPEGTGVGHATQPCFTNSEVLQLTIEAARQFFDRHPDQNTFSLCINDNSRYCECEKCAALDKPHRDLPVGRQYSESCYDYVSKVAEAVAESHPGRYLGVYAYWNVEQPPRNRKKLPDNVIVALTLDVLQHYDPAYRDKDRALVKAWSGFASRLHTYVYYGLGWYTPRTSPRLAAQDLQFAAGSGVRAIYCEAYPFWAWCGPMDYVAARLQWNAADDVNRILDEFHRDCFQDVAGQMRAFHEACERYWTRPRKGRWFEGLDRLDPEQAMADLRLLKEANDHLDAALNGSRSSEVRQRVAWIKGGFDFSMAVAKAFEADARKDSGDDRLRALVAAAEAVDQAHAKIAEDPAYRHSYYQPGSRFDRKCWGWFQGRIRGAAEACWKEIQGTSRGAANEKWTRLKEDSGLDRLLEQRAWELPFEQGKH